MEKESDKNTPTANNKVLFSRLDPNQDQEDVWDDRALIKAYEKSVRKIKKQLDSGSDEVQAKSTKKEVKEFEEEDEEDEEDEYEDESFDEENEGYYDEDADNEPGTNLEPINLKKKNLDDWKEEDLCLSVYSDDGLLYPANVIKIFEDENKRKKCIVKYLYYLNEEEKYLDEIYDYNKTKEKVDVKSEVKKTKELKDVKVNKQNLKIPELSQFPKFPQGLPVPPPPLPFDILGSEQNISLEDSLHSMLLSWYMSGYHTGYHFGRLEANKITNKAKSTSKS